MREVNWVVDFCVFFVVCCCTFVREVDIVFRLEDVLYVGQNCHQPRSFLSDHGRVQKCYIRVVVILRK